MVSDAVDAMMRREARHDLLMQPTGFGRDADPACGEVDEPTGEEGVAALVGVGDLGTQRARTPLLQPGNRLLEVGVAQRREGEGLQRQQPESQVVLLLCDLVRGARRGFVLVPHRGRGQRPGSGRRALLREVECLLEPAGDKTSIGLPLPHSPADGGRHRQLGVEIRRGAAEVDRRLHGGGERLAVVLEGIRVSDLLPDRGLAGGIGLELERLVEQDNRLVDLVACESQRRCAPSPGHRLSAPLGQLLVPAGPREVGVFRADGLQIVVGEQCCVLVVPLGTLLEPAGEGRVQLRSLRLWQARVGDLARERVLDCVLAFAGN